MKLKAQDTQPPMAGLPGAHREWWDLGDGYEIYIEIASDSCGIGIHSAGKSITYEMAGYLGVDTNVENISFDSRGRELYLSPSIDCVVLNYMKAENYKELLLKIEEIVNKYFKTKST
jgi:hypothetical protein